MFDSDIISNSKDIRRRYLNDLILLAACLLIAGLILTVIHISVKTGTAVEVVTGETVYGIYDLSVDRDVEIITPHGRNLLSIKGGCAVMTEADCPDLICVHTKPISKIGESIICLPHEVCVTVTAGSGSLDVSDEDTDAPDAFTW